jgi:hypothetical protein
MVTEKDAELAAYYPTNTGMAAVVKFLKKI